ncbi:MAG: uroporphyrinogen-III synthase [Flavobacteriaceae bacterium]|nr:uroporphyrinogen-III synthase [Flavobacteriaceae bacterium]
MNVKTSIRSVLVSQPRSASENTPYNTLKQKHKLKMDFRPFVHVDGLPPQEVRRQRITIQHFPNIIFTSRNAVDYFFKTCEDAHYKVPPTLKYFCQSKAVGQYLHQFAVYRKRRVCVGERSIEDLAEHFSKYSDEKFLLPSSDSLNPKTIDFLNSIGINWKRIILYRTVASDLSDLKNVYYDILVFYSPAGIFSLFKNFPDFKQNDTVIAVFGSSTVQAALDHNLRVDVKAPTSDCPSMTMAIDKYIQSMG